MALVMFSNEVTAKSVYSIFSDAGFEATVKSDSDLAVVVQIRRVPCDVMVTIDSWRRLIKFSIVFPFGNGLTEEERAAITNRLNFNMALVKFIADQKSNGLCCEAHVPFAGVVHKKAILDTFDLFTKVVKAVASDEVLRPVYLCE